MDDAFFHQQLKEKIANKNTWGNYCSRLSSLQRRIQQHYQDTNQPVPEKLVLHILTHPRAYYPIIEKLYNHKPSTIKNVVTCILAVYKYVELRCKLESPYKKWKEIHDRLCEEEIQRYNRNEPSDKQKDNYVTYADIQRTVDEFDNPHGRGIKTSMHYCLLCMYSSIRPKRADFGSIKVFQGEDPSRKDINYIVLGKESYFVFNHYNKTHREGAVIVESVPPGLAKVFLASLRAYPRKYLFVGRDGKPFKTSNAYSKFVIACFKKYLGKGTGVSLLRHLYINEKVDLNNLSIEEKEAIATAMGHTRKVQEQYKLFFDKPSKQEMVMTVS